MEIRAGKTKDLLGDNKETACCVAESEEKESYTVEEVDALLNDAKTCSEAAKKVEIDTLEGILRTINPEEGEYFRGLYNGIITTISILTRQSQEHRLVKEPRMIITAPGNFAAGFRKR